MRATGQEGLARNYYEACGTNGCSGNELYAFLSGFQPWFGKPSVREEGSASTRAAHLIDMGLRNTFQGTGRGLVIDVRQILDFNYASDSSRYWDLGKMSGRPWQWYGPFSLDPEKSPDFGYDSLDDNAILSVDFANGTVFWMFTSEQDATFDPDYWSP